MRNDRVGRGAILVDQREGVDEIKRIEGALDGKWNRWLDWLIEKCGISKGGLESWINCPIFFFF